MQKVKIYYNKLKNLRFTKKVVIECLLVVFLTSSFFLLHLNQAILSFYFNGFSNIFNAQVQVYSLYVGQGEASFIVLPDKTSILIDTGLEEYADRFCGELKAIMSANNLDQIDYLFLTHPHADHIGGTLKVFEMFDVENIYRPIVCSPSEQNLEGYAVSDNELYIEILEKAYEEGNVEYILPQDITLNTFTLKIWTPLSTYYSDLNDYSPVITLQNNETTLMFTGDLTIDSEAEFLEMIADINLDVDVLKVAHHGSKNATSEEFLAKTTPTVALISSGYDNSYKFPNETLVNRLQAYEVDVILATNTAGTIGVAINSGKITYQTGHIFQDDAFLLVMYLVLVFAVFSVREPKILVKKQNFQVNNAYSFGG